MVVRLARCLTVLLSLVGCRLSQCRADPVLAIGAGKCPSKTVVQNFQVERFMGLWYEVSRTIPEIELGGKCPLVQYTLNQDTGEIAGVYTITNPLTQTKHRASAKAVPAYPDADPPIGHYLATVDAINIYFLFNLPMTLPFLIMDTDYDNYAVVYTCGSFAGIIYGGGVVILSRAPVVPPDIQQKIDATIQRDGLTNLKYTKTDQSCN